MLLRVILSSLFVATITLPMIASFVLIFRVLFLVMSFSLSGMSSIWVVWVGFFSRVRFMGCSLNLMCLEMGIIAK